MNETYPFPFLYVVVFDSSRKISFPCSESLASERGPNELMHSKIIVYTVQKASITCDDGKNRRHIPITRITPPPIQHVWISESIHSKIVPFTDDDVTIRTLTRCNSSSFSPSNSFYEHLFYSTTMVQ